MKLVLLSGGSGKRLWPLSNVSRSKQFLKVLTNANEQDQRESMVQRLWRQLAACQLLDDVYISTNNKQVDIIQNQLGSDISLLIEPEKRDTFPAIALAASYLHSQVGIDSDEVIIVMPVDLYVDIHFFRIVSELEHVIHHSGKNIALIGVSPTYASTNYGYIIPKLDEDKPDARTYHLVEKFVEKPTEKVAQQLLEQKALWNCGIFAFSLGYLLKQMEKRGLPTKYNELITMYDKLPVISFDYEIVEKEDQTVVLPFDGEWKDIGTWNTLTETMQNSQVGKCYSSLNCANTHIINELDIPVVVVGISNAVVAASSEGILISDKSTSHHIKEIMKEDQQRPMFEEKRWGWYRVLEYKVQSAGREVLTKRLCIYAGKNVSYQYHHNRREVWVIVAGEGEFILDGVLSMIKAGDVIDIPVGAKHGIKAIQDLEMIEVQLGSKLEEEDIVRLSFDWEEIKKA